MKDQTHELVHIRPRHRCYNCEERTNNISVLMKQHINRRETRAIFMSYVLSVFSVMS